MTTYWWEVAQGAGALAAVLVSLWVLYLQRRDLGLERKRQRREQVNALMIDTRTETKASSSGGYTLVRSHMSLRNTSNRPLRVEGLTVRVAKDTSDQDWIPWGLRDLPIPLQQDGTFLLHAGESHEWEQPDGCHAQLNVSGGEFIVVSVRDADNNTWERRTDTYDLRSQSGASAPVAVEALRRVAVRRSMSVGGVPYLTLYWLSLRSVRKRPERMPWALRLEVALTGLGFEAGRADAWGVTHGDRAELFRHGCLLDPGPMWALATKAEWRNWQQKFEYTDPATWALGTARKRDLSRVIWRSLMDEHTASPLGWIRPALRRAREIASR